MGDASELKAALAKSMGLEAQAGYDVVIICCSGVIEAAYWQQRLESTRGVVLAKDCQIYSVDEDWNGGAGNGLGTLYAFQKAAAAAKAKGVDLLAQLEGGASAAIYHTAGKGTRLAPLPAAENNNKPGVKLPATVRLADGSYAPITILEAVLKQTAAYAAPRKGRLSVFWGDQIFIPSADPNYTPTAHIDLLAQLLDKLPTAEVWKEKGLSSYGLAVQFESGGGAQIEKVDHATATGMLSSLGSIATVGPSLGSFSVSAPMLAALMKEFAAELEKREGQLDTDPHFWMPLTLPEAAYVEMMGKKGWTAEQSVAHYKRMQAMLAGFDKQGMHLFGAVNVGEDAYWWDYGQIGFYLENNLRLTKDGAENDAYRAFFSAQRGEPTSGSQVASGVSFDKESTAAACVLHSGSVQQSALCNVTAGSIEAKGAILVNVTAKKLRAAPGAIAYNVVDDSEEGLVLEAGKIVTTVFAEDGTQTRLLADMAGPDGKEAWSTVLPGNTISYEQMHKQNKGVDPQKCQAAQLQAHQTLAKVIAEKANL